MKVLIVGGVAGGATTAARLRRLNEENEIILFERGEHISYANCGLPYYIGGTIEDRENLFVQTPESFNERFNIDVRVQNEVLSIDKEKNNVEVKNLKTGEVYRETYDKLLLSPGAEPVKPPIPGINSKKIFTLRNVADTDKIKEFIDAQKPQKAVIIGAGFIGLEMAENLYNRGMQVTVVEMSSQVMAPIDFEMAAEIHQHMKMKDVELYLNDGVASFEEGQAEQLFVTLNSGRKVKADLVILSIGVRPDSRLAKVAGLKVADRGGIIVNEFLQTSDKDIYAVGDAIVFENPITKKVMPTYLAGPANKQGRLVADNIVFGNKKVYKGAINTAIAKVFDLTVAATGMPEKVIKKANIEYQIIISHHSSHAGYYPGALPFTQKVIYNKKDGKLLGAQLVGYEGIDKRVDIYATVIGFGGTVYDLQQIEHSYAPPFSSAKDPVNYAGFIAENIEQGLVKTINWDEFDKHDINHIIILDVRTDEEFKLGYIEGAINIPLDDLRNNLDKLDQNKKIVVYCGVGLRGYLGCRILMENGFKDVYNYNGGYKTYEHVHQKQSNEDIFENDVIGKDDSIYKKSKQVDLKVDLNHVVKIDACGLQCPGPIMKLKKSVDEIEELSTLEIRANDPGFFKDVKAWCESTGNKLVNLRTDKADIIAQIQKMPKQAVSPVSKSVYNDKTIVVFSDALDRALATFVIANGAASMGKKVTLFFTFWGLNILKKENVQGKNKSLTEKMLASMNPKGKNKLTLSKLNMGGLGTGMLKRRMSDLNIDSLDQMMKIAQENGVRFVACQMSMDMFGVKKEELIDGVEIGGVATYLNDAEKANLNLFI